MSRAPIVLLTDFGLADGYPGVMKGVIYSFSPEVPIIDLSHGVPAHHLGSAAFLLWKSYHYFPRDSIFVVVIDPGVGSGRKILYLRWREWHFLAPDNGVLSPFLERGDQVEEVREVTQSDLFLARRGRTFDGRDRFAPVVFAALWHAACQANGWEESEARLSMRPLLSLIRLRHLHDAAYYAGARGDSPRKNAEYDRYVRVSLGLAGLV